MKKSIFNPYNSGRPREINVSQRGTSQIPAKRGEYRILKKDTKEVVYIGITNNLRRRATQHIQTGKLSTSDNCIFAFKTADGRASWRTICKHEINKIKQHSPALNQRNGGAGRPPVL